MLPGALPDLASTLRLQRDAAQVRAGLDLAARELSTGRREDATAASGRNPERLYALERARSRAETDLQGLEVAAGRLATTQTVLGGLEGLADELGVDLRASLARGDMTSARLHASGAADAFRSAVATLNTRYAGRTLFAGAAVDGPALASPESMLADIRGLVTGAADAADAVARVEDYFGAAGGGFETSGYVGSTAEAPLAALDGGAVRISRRADDAEVRTLLTGLALAAAATDPAYSGPAEAQPVLLAAAADATLEAREAIVASRADLGRAEQALEEASVRAAARRDALELAWNEATARDPFEAATEFQALEQQLERVFAVTARLSRLTLTGFLR